MVYKFWWLNPSERLLEFPSLGLRFFDLIMACYGGILPKWVVSETLVDAIWSGETIEFKLSRAFQALISFRPALAWKDCWLFFYRLQGLFYLTFCTFRWFTHLIAHVFSVYRYRQTKIIFSLIFGITVLWSFLFDEFVFSAWLTMAVLLAVSIF